jgi:hypothetical protein
LFLFVFSDSGYYPLTGPNGWLWYPTGKKIGSNFSGWSNTGGVGESQPDNLSNRYGGSVEACLGLLNNWFGDGVAWHDMPCDEKMSVICKQT